ncbi:hypothetical protein CPB85DRAFT_393002 [Mucidula mucida]|nr:hypothetical protein CPB85DRAFT_393002 [Mucidula mucida]
MPSCSLSSCHFPTSTILIVLVAELKERASKVKDASVTKIQNTRDRHSSVPLKNTNWDPYSGKPPPPPPPARTSTSKRPTSLSPPPLAPPPQRAGSVVSSSSTSSLSSGPPPPPVKRATRPPISSPGSAPGPPLPQRSMSSASYASQEAELDWRNLSQQDKEVFFSWLDEFFERSYGIATR